MTVVSGDANSPESSAERPANWSRSTSPPARSSGRQNSASAAFGAPTVVNDLVFATTFDGIVHALDAKTGGEVWQATLPAGINAGVMVSGDTLIAPAGLPTAEGQNAANRRLPPRRRE